MRYVLQNRLLLKVISNVSVGNHERLTADYRSFSRAFETASNHCFRPSKRDPPPMQVEKVKYVLWAADWQRCLKFYREMFGGVVSFEMEVWSEIVIAGATIGVHGGGEGKRTWTGLSFQLDDLREGISRLIECGGQLASEPNDTPDDPLHLAMCIDPEGNEFMMTQKRKG
jgi:lactoylglutathione lyase